MRVYIFLILSNLNTKVKRFYEHIIPGSWRSRSWVGNLNSSPKSWLVLFQNMRFKVENFHVSSHEQNFSKYCFETFVAVPLNIGEKFYIFLQTEAKMRKKVSL